MSKENCEIIIDKLSELDLDELASLFNGMNKGCLSVLLYIRTSNKKIKAGDIAKRFNISTARVSLVIKKLELYGYAKRIKDKKDNRITYVELTKRGQQKVDNSYKGYYQTLEKVVDSIGIEELINFIDTASKINDAIKKIKEDK